MEERGWEKVKFYPYKKGAEGGRKSCGRAEGVGHKSSEAILALLKTGQ